MQRIVYRNVKTLNDCRVANGGETNPGLHIWLKFQNEKGINVELELSSRAELTRLRQLLRVAENELIAGAMPPFAVRVQKEQRMPRLRLTKPYSLK